MFFSSVYSVKQLFILVSVDAVYAMAHALHNLVLHQVDTNRNGNTVENTDLNGLDIIEVNTYC